MNALTLLAKLRDKSLLPFQLTAAQTEEIIEMVCDGDLRHVDDEDHRSDMMDAAMQRAQDDADERGDRLMEIRRDAA